MGFLSIQSLFSIDLHHFEAIYLKIKISILTWCFRGGRCRLVDRGLFIGISKTDILTQLSLTLIKLAYSYQFLMENSIGMTICLIGLRFSRPALTIFV